MLDQLALGLGQIATLSNLLVLILGLLVGMLVAILPGLTLVMGVALALPFTYAMGMIPAVILLTAIYVSGTYGGAFTSILFRVPGEPFDIPLMWDGHAMARAGGAAKALGLVLLAALFRGFLSLLFMVAVVEPFAKIAVRLSTAEYFALILGIPGSGTTAILYGALLLHGVQPGPQLFLRNAEVPYTIFATMLVSLIGTCLVGYLFIRALMRVLEAPEVLVAAFVVAFCFVGTLAVRNNVSDLWVIVAFGAVGWLFERYRLPLAPMVLGVILGPMAEGYFMTTMIAANNDWTVFLTRPLSATLLAASVLSLAVPILREHWHRRSHGTPEPARS